MQRRPINFNFMIQNDNKDDDEDNSGLPNLDCTDGVKILAKYAQRKARIKPGSLFAHSSPPKTNNGFKQFFVNKKTDDAAAAERNKKTAATTEKNEVSQVLESQPVPKPTVPNNLKSKIPIHLSNRVLLNEFNKNNENIIIRASTGVNGGDDYDFSINSFDLGLPVSSSTPSTRTITNIQKEHRFAIPKLSNVIPIVVNLPPPSGDNNDDNGDDDDDGGGGGGNGTNNSDRNGGGGSGKDGNGFGGGGGGGGVGGGGNITINITVPPSPMKCTNLLATSQQSNNQQQMNTSPVNRTIPQKTPTTPSRKSLSFISRSSRPSIDLLNTPKSTKVKLLAALDVMCAEKNQQLQKSKDGQLSLKCSKQLLPSQSTAKPLSPPQSKEQPSQPQLIAKQHQPQEPLLVNNDTSTKITRTNKSLPLTEHSQLKHCFVELTRFNENQIKTIDLQTANTANETLISEDETDKENDIIDNEILLNKNNNKICVISCVKLPQITVTKPTENDVEINRIKNILPTKYSDNFLKPPTPKPNRSLIINNEKPNSNIISHTLNLQNSDVIVDNSPNTAMSLQTFYRDLSNRDKTAKRLTITKSKQLKRRSTKLSTAAIEFQNFLNETKRNLRNSAINKRNRRKLYSTSDATGNLTPRKSTSPGNNSKTNKKTKKNTISSDEEESNEFFDKNTDVVVVNNDIDENNVEEDNISQDSDVSETGIQEISHKPSPPPPVVSLTSEFKAPSSKPLTTDKKRKRKKKNKYFMKCPINKYEPFNRVDTNEAGCRRSNRERRPVKPRIYQEQILQSYNNNKETNTNKIKKAKLNNQPPPPPTPPPPTPPPPSPPPPMEIATQTTLTPNAIQLEDIAENSFEEMTTPSSNLSQQSPIIPLPELAPPVSPQQQNQIQSVIKLVRVNDLDNINIVNGIQYMTGANKLVGLIQFEANVFKSNVKSAKGVELTCLLGNVTVTVDSSIKYELNWADSILIPAGSLYSIQNAPDRSILRYRINEF